MARRNAVTIDPLAVQIAAGLMGISPAQPAQSKPREKMTEKSAVVLSVHEIGLLVQAVESGESTDWSVDLNDPGHRTSKVNVLDDVDAAKFRGRYQVVRSLTPRVAPKLTPEQEEIARLRAELAAIKFEASAESSDSEAAEGVSES